MYIVIGGGGIAGAALAGELVNRKHDVVVIDINKETCEMAFAQTGAVTIIGKATEIGTLQEAGIEKADVAISALYRDEDNLTFALLAHSFNVPNIYVKMRNPAYRDAYRVAGVTVICDIVGMFKNKVIAELENPDLKVITPLEENGTKLVMFRLPGSWPSEGRLIYELAKEPAFCGDCLFTGILNEKHKGIIVPHGNDRVYPGDRIFVVAGPKSLKAITKYLAGIRKKKLPPPLRTTPLHV
ncbi:MAG: TrkA family potassium uptake protein [Deltaproteobacteria bacterium]|nr:TrkA family potassium uptake protein [Deltaproteobacteria bacterium]